MFDDNRFRILVVCTGNVCRSPLAERSLQAGFDYVWPGVFGISSAGTHALVGQTMTAEVRSIAREWGVPSEGFVSKQLIPQMLDSADLVLTLTREHSALILEDHPLLLKRTFTLREFARILCARIRPVNGVDARERWESVVQQALRNRGAGYIGPEFDDVVDPYGRSNAVYEQMAGELFPAVRAIVEWELEAASDP